MKEKDENPKKVSSSKEIMEFVKILDKKVPLSELRTNLRKVAESRGLVGANLELHFHAGDERRNEYYNVYKYAFFGMVPEVELDPRARTISPPAIGKAKLFGEKKR
jgi:hypothetical protein